MKVLYLVTSLELLALVHSADKNLGEVCYAGTDFCTAINAACTNSVCRCNPDFQQQGDNTCIKGTYMPEADGNIGDHIAEGNPKLQPNPETCICKDGNAETTLSAGGIVGIIFAVAVVISLEIAFILTFLKRRNPNFGFKSKEDTLINDSALLETDNQCEKIRKDDKEYKVEEKC